MVQVLTDGDEDLERYIKEFFPTATHTIDIIHVIERIWECARLLFPRDLDKQKRWAEEMKDWLYRTEKNDGLSRKFRIS